ncbi:MAG: hypothetical protein L0H64_13755 [Pseudonocardia sp.]|nr:hypothetical protein [Pseudonocardia sp.]
MTRVVDVARIHVVNRRLAVGLPLAVLLGVLLLNIAIAIVAGTGEVKTGSVTAIYAVVGITMLQAITQFFGFALGLGVTRRAFYAGTALFAVVQAIGYGLLLTLGVVAERATGGWGVGLSFFRFGVSVQESPVVHWLDFSAGLLVFSAAGVAFGVVFKRWGLLGVYATLLTLAAVLIAAAAVIGWQGWWPQVFSLFSSLPSPVAGAGVLALCAVAIGGAGWLVLRCATP